MSDPLKHDRIASLGPASCERNERMFRRKCVVARTIATQTAGNPVATRKVNKTTATGPR